MITLHNETDPMDEVVPLQQSLNFLQTYIHYFTAKLCYHCQNIEHHSNQQPLTIDESSQLIAAVIRGLKFNDHCMHYDHDFSDPYALMFHSHTLHWQILQLLLTLIDNKSVQLPIAELLPIVKKITLANQSPDTRQIAMKVMVKFMQNEPQELINELLAILHQANSVLDVTSAAARLTDVIIAEPAKFSANDQREIIKHLIPLLRMEHSAHETVLSCFAKLWHITPKAEQQAYLTTLFSFTDNNSGEIRQAIVRLFLKVDVETIAAENITFIVDRILRLLPIEDNDNFLRFACGALRRIQTSIADPETATRITLALIKLVEADKLELRVLYALEQLDASDCAIVLAARSDQARLFIDRLLAMLISNIGAYCANRFLKKIAADQQFTLHHDRIQIALEQYHSTRLQVRPLLADADLPQPHRSQRHIKSGALFKRADDIFWRASGQSRQQSNLFVILDTVLHDSNQNNCWHALRELLAVFDEVSINQQRQIINTMQMAFTRRPELRHNILSNLSAFTQSAFADKIFELYIHTYISSDDERLCAVSKEVVTCESFLPSFFQDHQQVTVWHLGQLGLMTVRFGDVEFIAQVIDLCTELGIDETCSAEVRTAALQAMLTIAANTDNSIIQLQIIASIHHINARQNLPEIILSLLKSYYADECACAHRLGWHGLWSIAGDKQLQQPIGNWLEQGLAAFNRGDYAAASQCFTKGIQMSEELPHLLHFYHGRALLAMEQSLSAIKEFALAEKQYPDFDYSQIHYYRALAYIKQDRLDDAVTNLRDAIHHYPCFFAAHEKLAEVYYRLHHVRQARAVIDDIREFKPGYRGFRSDDVEQWLATRVGNYSLTYFPRQTELDALYAFVVDNADDIQQHVDDLLVRAVAIFGQVTVDKIAAVYGFCAEELSDILYVSEKRRYVMHFIQALLLQTFWQEYHNGYRVITDERARQNDLQRLATESQILNIFREVGVPGINDVDSMLHVVNQHCHSVHGVFNFLRLFAADQWLAGGFALGATNDVGSTYSVFTRLFGLQRWETVYGQHWLCDSCNDRVEGTSYGNYQILDSDHHTDRFFKLVVQANKPIVFFVPTNMGAKENINGVTYGELAWVAQAIKKGYDDLLKNIIIVFDAYNYLPLHMLREANINKIDVSKLVVDDQLLTAVTDFIATRVVAETDRVDFVRHVQENLQQDNADAVRGEILTELILIVGYNSRCQSTNTVAKPALLDAVKAMVDTLFAARDPTGFFTALERYLQQLNLNQPDAVDDVCHCVQFVQTLLSDADYVPYVNPDNQSVTSIISFLRQASLLLRAAESRQTELVDILTQIIRQQTALEVDADTLARLLIISIGQNADYCADLIEYFNTQPITTQRYCLAAMMKVISQALYDGAMEYCQSALAALLKLFEQPQCAADFSKHRTELLTLLDTALNHKQPDAIYASCQQLVLLATAEVKQAGRVSDWLPSVCRLILVAHDATHALQCLEQLAQHNPLAVAASLNRFFSHCDLQGKFRLLDRLSDNRLLLQLHQQAIMSAVTTVNSHFNSMSDSELTTKLKIICRCFQAITKAELVVPVLSFKIFLKKVLATKNHHYLPNLLAAYSLIGQLTPQLNQEVIKITIAWLQQTAHNPIQLTYNDELFVIDLLKKHYNKFNQTEQRVVLSLFVNGLAVNKFVAWRTQLQRNNKNFMNKLFEAQDPIYLQRQFTTLAQQPDLLIADAKVILADLADCLGFNQPLSSVNYSARSLLLAKKTPVSEPNSMVSGTERSHKL